MVGLSYVIRFSGRFVQLSNRKYSNHLNTGLVWYSNVRFMSGCEIVQYSNGGPKNGLKKLVNGPKCSAFNGPPSHLT